MFTANNNTRTDKEIVEENKFFDGSDKGFAHLKMPQSKDAFLEEKWNIKQGSMSFPLALIKSERLDHNLKSMQAYADSHGLLFSPHGKTTMSPELFKRQLQNGAWGITISTLQQFRHLNRLKCPNILLANALIDESSHRFICQSMNTDPSYQLYLVLDSVEQVNLSSLYFEKYHLQRPVQTFIEAGIDGHRTGLRKKEDLHALAHTIEKSPYMNLCGLAGYEGLIKGEKEMALQNVDTYLDRFLEWALELQKKHLPSENTLLTMGGSVYFDRACEKFLNSPLCKSSQLILRCGSYVTHDHGFYHQHQNNRLSRTPGPEFKPAIELWAHVQSLPEPGLAILNFGRRDAAMEAEMPVPLKSYHPDHGFTNLKGYEIFKTNDQHAYMKLPADHRCFVGQHIICGCSRPSMIFDKWKKIAIVNNDYDIVDVIETCF